jgi:hypothetical protein
VDVFVLELKLERPFLRQARRLILLCLIPIAASFGQQGQSTQGPNLEILRLKWEKDARLPPEYDPSAGSTGSFSDPTRSSAGGGSGRSAAVDQGVAPPPPPSRVSWVYVYSMKVKNTGPKPIDAVAWDYLLLDPGTKAVVARHQFLSFEKVQPGKTVTFEAQQRIPPVRKTKVDGKESGKPLKFVEQAIIHCVLYADETSWRDLNTPESVCDLLKKGRSNLKHARNNSKPN